jgi:hypothetical protein
MHSQRWDLEIFGTHKRVFYYHKAKPKIRIQPFGAVTYKNLMLWNNQAHSLT